MSLKDYPPQTGRMGYIVLSLEKRPDHYLLIRDCPFCGKESEVVVPAQGLWDWEHGEFVQVAMPTLTADQREIVMSGTHADCWNRAFPDERQ